MGEGPRYVRVEAALFAVLLSTGCSEAPAEAPGEEAQAAAAEVSEPMEPLTPRPPEEDETPAEPRTAPEPTTWSVILGVRSIGWHRFPGVRKVEGPWEIEGVVEEPGDESVDALGRRLEGCRTTELAHGRATWCPEAGVVSRTGREGQWQVEETLIAIRRGDSTWAASPCDAMHLVTADERASLCDRPIRTYGADPLPGRSPGGETCRWRYAPDGPLPDGVRRSAIVTVQLAPHAATIDEWANAGPTETLVEARGARTWIARRGEWAAAVRIRRDACGDAEGAALAERLVELAPE